ncbi:putative protein [Zhongshania aliphaticivorans]|uniref:AB hydrolase-1 domain-containing protein n=1 Tax=Zhongshania aliphaticivorans TaxID=1470434 RepID=A0A5S9MWA6_9GAMM|nr:alpha/beta hydrolase [Zhongshania aliphaticivorans]CAA0081368.1 putative protein [Zhongshania aliphaticivorans]CAA0084938.1 putative protein [Zhongshania aliphaticivorans]
MAKFLKVLLLGVATLLLVIAAYIAWSLLAYRDIPTAELVARYGQGAQFADLEGTPIAYRVSGDLNAGPPWVLLHSHYFDSLMWDDVISHLAPGHAVIRYDMTSHGLSGPDAQSNYSMDRDVAILDALLNKLNVKSALVVGSSLGGNIAFHYAAKFPERTAGLVLINSGGIKRQQSSRRSAAGIPPWFYRVFYFIPTIAYRKFIEWMVVDKTVVSESLVERFHDMFRHKGNRQAEMQRMASFDAGEPSEVLGAIRAPSLIIWGRKNPQLPVALMTQFENLMTNTESITSEIVDGTGHLLPVERPEITATLLDRFRGSL